MKNQYDLTRGPILSKLLVVAVPVMGTQFMQMAYNLADMFWMGRLGGDAVAATGAAGMYLWLSYGFLLFGRVGAEIGVSQNLGRGEPETARLYGQTSLVLSAVLGLAFMAAMLVFCKPLVGFFGFRETHVIRDAQLYLNIVSLGVPFTFMAASLGGSFAGSGNTRVPFVANTVGLVINLILDPVLIFGAGWGVAGAAISTIFAQALVFFFLLWASKKRKDRPFPEFRMLVRPDSAVLLQIVRWGIPVAAESLCFTVFTMLITRMAARFGASAVAGQRIGSQIESLSWLIAGGFSTAVASFVGQNFGAGRWTRIHRGFRLSMLAMLLWGFVCTAVLFFGAKPLFAAFLKEPEALAAGVSYMRILAASQLLSCLEYTTSGCFRGMGKTLPPSVASIVSNAARVPLAWLLLNGPLGLDGIWWGLSIGAVARGLWMVVWYLLDRRHMPTADVSA